MVRARQSRERERERLFIVSAIPTVASNKLCIGLKFLPTLLASGVNLDHNFIRLGMPLSLPGLPAHTCMGTLPLWEPMWLYPVGCCDIGSERGRVHTHTRTLDIKERPGSEGGRAQPHGRCGGPLLFPHRRPHSNKSAVIGLIINLLWCIQ